MTYDSSIQLDVGIPDTQHTYVTRIYVLVLHRTRIMVILMRHIEGLGSSDGEVWRCSGPSITDAETACAGRLVFRLTSIHTLRNTSFLILAM